MGETLEREAVADRFKWDLSVVYGDRESWEQDYAAVEQYLDKLQQYEGRTADDADTLHEVLLLKNQISRKIGTLNFYARARRREDMREDEYDALVSRVTSLSSASGQVKSFIQPEILDAGQERIAAMVDTHPGLQMYERYLDEVFRYKPHNLGQEQEALVSQISEVLGNENDIHSKLLNADIQFPTVEAPDEETVEITHSNWTNLLKHPNRDFRQHVYTAYAETWSRFEQTLASNYANKVKHGVVFADIRDHESVRARNLKANKIPETVYENLVDTIHEHADTVRREQKLRAAFWDLDTLRPWDTSLPLVASEPPEVTYNESKQFVLDALQPMGEEYVSAAADGLDSGWIDVYPNRGKQSGAFSWGTYDTPPYLFMNFEDDISSMYTLAHELGHSMHRWFRDREQPYQHAGTPTFINEVVSTVNEALLTDHLLNTIKDDEFRQHVLSYRLRNVAGKLFGQTRLADFEHRVHETAASDEPLTADRLNSIYRDVQDQFTSDIVKRTEYSDKAWMRIPHLYRPYYVYQYATGTSAALDLVQQINDETDPDAADRYLTLLKQGGSDFPIPLLKNAGVDLTSPEPVENAIDTYDRYLDQMEAFITS